jgi:Cu+-exporting ATPase
VSTSRSLVVQESTELAIGGMTCASCANRVERELNTLPGVVATVNVATERAHVSHPATVSTAELVATVNATGYSATLPSTAPTTDDTRSLTLRVVVSALLTLPVVLLAMVPALQFDGWEWVSLVLSVPVVAWGAWPFHHAAWTNLRHGATTMDTLVSMGVVAAFGW